MRNMFNFRLSPRFCSQLKYCFASRHRVYETKNNSILIVQDSNNQLPYMAEVQLADSSKGFVIKIQDTGKAYLAMYDQFESSTIPTNHIEITQIRKNWKQSLQPLIQSPLTSHFNLNPFYDVNLNKIAQNPNQTSSIHTKSLQITNGQKKRLNSSSPVLNICHDLYYGDMIAFMGCKGSKKSSNSWKIAKQFTANSDNNLAVYLNPNFQEVKAFTETCRSSLSFTTPKNKKPTDAGVYMLTLKAIKLSSELKKKGLNVLLIIDNFSEIMYRQWNLLQSIKFDSKVKDSSKIFQYNTLKIPPVSVMNEIYSNCEDKSTGKNKSRGNKESGSLTSIIISEKQNNELVQQISSYGNNLKHLQTLSYVIEFPLNFKINTNLYYPKSKSQQQFETLKTSSGFEEKDLHRFLRAYVNKYLNEKRQTELKRQLYKNDIKEAPWDYFFLLDSEWWTTGIKQFSNTSNSYKEANQFLRWIVYNIEKDYLGHWNLTAIESYRRFISYFKSCHNLEESTSAQTLQLAQEEMDAFLEEAKMEGLVNPFKKDYLI